MWLLFAALAVSVWLIVLVLPWQPWRITETFSVSPLRGDADLSEITVLIPARNEADVIGKTLAAIAQQGNGLQIIIADDASSDDTVAVAQRSNIDSLSVLSVPARPSARWSGKLWALESVRCAVKTPYILLLDADILLRPGTLASLYQKMRHDNLGLVSLMAKLNMTTFWEKLLMPAFIFFFGLLYPFALVNRPRCRVAGAAGGCLMLKTALLEEIGGFSAIRHCLIDDCALAQQIKKRHKNIWLGLTHAAVSQRIYLNLHAIWEMVARSAFAQLRYSFVCLLLCVLVMSVAFVLPWLAIVAADGHARLAAMGAVVLMWLSYLPTLRYYERGFWWVGLLPVTGVLFMLMTITSAVQHLLGKGVRWKERHYR